MVMVSICWEKVSACDGCATLKVKLRFCRFLFRMYSLNWKRCNLLDRACCKGCPRRKTYRGDNFNQLQNSSYPFKNSHLALPLWPKSNFSILPPKIGNFAARSYLLIVTITVEYIIQYIIWQRSLSSQINCGGGVNTIFMQAVAVGFIDISLF